MLIKYISNCCLLFGLLLIVAIPISRLHAQCEGDCEQPFIFVEDGNIIACYPSSGEQVILSGETGSDGVAMSPDGTFVAFRSPEDGVAEAIAEFRVTVPSQQPSNIWLWQVGTDAPMIIADQPENATISEAIGFEHMIERSPPVWSPDGTQLAWSAFDLDAWTFQVMVYSLEDQTTEILVENPPSGFQDVVFYLYPPSWGVGGIVFVQINILSGNNNGPPSFREVLTVFDPEDGSGVFSGVITDSDSDSIEDWVWLDEGATLALLYDDEHWEGLDIETGERTVIDSPLSPVEDEVDYGLCEMVDSQN